MSDAEVKNPDWGFHPELPIENAAIFEWPPRPDAAVRSLVAMWLPLTTSLVWLLMAFAAWTWLSPSLETMATFNWDWVALIYVRNLLTMLVIGGFLHLYFYSFKMQGERWRFDTRSPGKNQKKFTLGSQIKDNMIWSLGSGVFFWVAYEVIYLWAYANDWVPSSTWAENPIWFVAWFLLIPIWSSGHFYFIHRALHSKLLYKPVHALHHRNINIGPFSGLSMHPVEHLLYYSSVAIHFIVPSDPVHMLFHLYVQALNPLCSHSGYMYLEVAGRRVIMLGDFFHQLHHRYFECNYGTAAMPWDKWVGSFHNGAPEATAKARERMRALQGAAR